MPSRSRMAKRVVPRVACVNHQWKIVRVRERDLRREDRLLHLAWRMVVVVIEPRLTHCDHLGVIEQRGDAVDALRGVVGMDARGRPHVVVGLRPRRVAISECSRSVPTVMSATTPAARASAITSSSSARRWQWLSIHATRGSALEPREQRLGRRDRQRTRIATPLRGGGQSLVERRNRADRCGAR